MYERIDTWTALTAFVFFISIFFHFLIFSCLRSLFPDAFTFSRVHVYVNVFQFIFELLNLLRREYGGFLRHCFAFACAFVCNLHYVYAATLNQQQLAAPGGPGNQIHTMHNL